MPRIHLSDAMNQLKTHAVKRRACLYEPNGRCEGRATPSLRTNHLALMCIIPRRHSLPSTLFMPSSPNESPTGAHVGVQAQDGPIDLERKNLTLDSRAIEVFKKIGGGEMSLGAREAARRLAEHGLTEPFSPHQHQQRNRENGST